MTNWQRLASLKPIFTAPLEISHSPPEARGPHSPPLQEAPSTSPVVFHIHKKTQKRIIRFNLRTRAGVFVCVFCRRPVMVELGQADTEVYAPKRTIQVWRTLLNWLAFFFQIFVQIIRATPSLINYSSSSSSPSFEPLPVVELPESPEPPPPYAAAAVRIPPAVADYNCLEKLTVVLDLDETLVCAYETSSLPAIVRTQATDAGLNWFELECISSDKECEGKSKVNYVTVFERPGLHEFLALLSKFADLVLFTAGLEGYAKPLVDRIDAENRFSRRLYRPSTTSTEFREHVKDLSCISTDFCRIVIVDNNPFSFLLQPVNGIPCIPFSAGQPHDDQLLEVLLPLLKQLSEQGDVRPVLYERFHMPEWFHKHGIPASGWATHG